MKIDYIQILIERDPMTKVPKAIAPWELPVVEARYDDAESEGNGFVEIGSVEAEMDVPDADEEFARLRNAHGLHPKEGRPFADIAYGTGKAGVRALRKAINEAFDVEEEEVEDAKPARKAGARKAAPAKPADPLAD